MSQLSSDENELNKQKLPEREEDVKSYHPAMFANHPFHYLILWLLIIGGGIGAVMGMFSGNFPLGIFGLLSLICGGVAYGWWYLNVKFKVLTITDKRTLYRQGILSKRTNEVQHDDVRNIQMDQTFLQRVLNVGDIAISSSGQDDMEIVVKGVGNPQEIVDLVRRFQ
ncbi:PH domain-containing protein [uncultured Rubinisphaera sp.]|uniref:PH domain-containing protein n=1 Tax=uncultured Rubinisphaera sp. TaxID=1678686 RepID=UPI0030D87539